MMATAPAAYETLTPEDVNDIQEELLPAQSQSYVVGLKLGLPTDVLDFIHSKCTEPRECLLHVLLEFTKQTEPRPTWRVIVNSLKSSAVGLYELADVVQTAHFPDPAATHIIEPHSIELDVQKAGPCNDDDKSTHTSGNGVESGSAYENMTTRIQVFQGRFKTLREHTVQGLGKCHITVMAVLSILSALNSVRDQQVFSRENQAALYECQHHQELFGALNFYCSYLICDLFVHIVRELTTKHTSWFKDLLERVAQYERDLTEFKKNVTLKSFSGVKLNMVESDPPPGFRKVVVQFEWPETATIECIEMFKQCYAQHYGLHTCVILVNWIGTNSFVLFMPTAVVKLVKKNRVLNVYKEFSITRVDCDGSCVFQAPLHQKVIPSSVTWLQQQLADYPFLEQPSEDFFCPVTADLLLQPHLTSCCGKHLSQEAATKIKGKKGACPLCNVKVWSTMLDKHFQRQVNSLCVLCRHEQRGCTWQGDVSTFDSRVQFCAMKYAPLMITKLNSLVCGKDVERQPITSQSGALQNDDKLIVHHHFKERGPRRLYRGSATSDDQLAYFTPVDSTSLYRYEWSTEKWRRLLQCPYQNSGLVVINGSLTAVGGRDGSYCTNQLFTLIKRQWFKEYPPMDTACSSPAVVSVPGGDLVVVIGGYAEQSYKTTLVRLLQISTCRWYNLKQLPKPLPFPSALMCGNELSVIGSNGQSCSCSLQQLNSHKPILHQAPKDTLTWKPLPCLPVRDSAVATLCGQLVSFGGERGGAPVGSIYQLLDQCWVEIGSMASCRWRCSVASFPPDRVIVVGGGFGTQALDIVEECIAFSPN